MMLKFVLFGCLAAVLAGNVDHQQPIAAASLSPDQGSCHDEGCGETNATHWSSSGQPPHFKCESKPILRRLAAPRAPSAQSTSSFPRSDVLHELTLVAISSNSNSFASQRFQRACIVNGLKVEFVEDFTTAKNVVTQLAESYGNVVGVVDASRTIPLVSANEILTAFRHKSAFVVTASLPDCLQQTDDTVEVLSSMSKLDRCVGTSGIFGYADKVFESMVEMSALGQVSDSLAAMLQTGEAVVDVEAQMMLDVTETTNLAESDVYVHLEQGDNVEPHLAYLPNKAMPTVVAAASSNTILNQIGNYLPHAWNSEEGCILCNENRLCIDDEMNLPELHVFLHFNDPAPFLNAVLSGFTSQRYPTSKMHVTAFISSAVAAHEDWVQFIESPVFESYASFKIIEDGAANSFSSFRSFVDTTKQTIHENAFIFVMDQSVRLTSNEALWHLVTLNKPMVAPKLTRQNKYWSNFWGDMSIMKNGDDFDIAYVRSFDYFEIVQRTRSSIYAVPLVFSSVMFKGNTISQLDAFMSSSSSSFEASWWTMSYKLCLFMTKNGVQPTVSNVIHYGHMINADDFDSRRAHPELYLLEDNPQEWEQMYLHPEYHNFKQHGFIEGCNDVFKVPFMSPKFASDLVAETEHFGKWSAGDHDDERLQGGYEPVPTQDIHLNQIGFDKSWYKILTTYLRPIAAYHYTGYFLEGRKTLDFVVRYRPDRQASLKPHHDASTVTLNMALNQGGVDYQGGGTRFVRQNCTLLNTPPGWGTLSPGRLTHQHEGLETTEGTRYILVSFIDQ